jgi:hypothetical protein
LFDIAIKEINTDMSPAELHASGAKHAEAEKAAQTASVKEEVTDSIAEKSPTEDLRPISNSTEKSHENNPVISEVVDEEDGIEYPGPLKLTVIMAGLCLSVFLVALDQTIIATAVFCPFDLTELN